MNTSQILEIKFTKNSTYEVKIFEIDKEEGKIFGKIKLNGFWQSATWNKFGKILQFNPNNENYNLAILPPKLRIKIYKSKDSRVPFVNISKDGMPLNTSNVDELDISNLKLIHNIVLEDDTF